MQRCNETEDRFDDFVQVSRSTARVRFGTVLYKYQEHKFQQQSCPKAPTLQAVSFVCKTRGSLKTAILVKCVPTYEVRDCMSASLAEGEWRSLPAIANTLCASRRSTSRT